ncbi:helix-turn-helix domain-containing protein [Streptococcus ferus]|uniref:helix-turn-helix domain-containing protein n=1 Tax=Streptococcus ferus TaxID=1345 RepID=UPI003517F34C
MLKNFGIKVRELRAEKGLTKEIFCQDETELSIRQLTRIENGQSLPTLNKVVFIAKRLGVSVGSLTDGEMIRLPHRYQELKYLVIRTPTYMDSERIAKVESYLDEIYTDYYDTLPEEEQIAVETLQSSLDIHVTDNIEFGDELLLEYFEQIISKKKYRLNDLLVIRLYFYYITAAEFKTDLYSAESIELLAKKLTRQTANVPIGELFLLRDILIQVFTIQLLTQNYKQLQRVITELNHIFDKSQDYQKKPIVSMMEWKFHLSIEKNYDLAEKCYQEAAMFARLTNDQILEERIHQEWKEDMKK